MADRAQLSEAIDQAIRALEELKRVWEVQEESAPAAAPQQQAAAPTPAPVRQAAPAGKSCRAIKADFFATDSSEKILRLLTGIGLSQIHAFPGH